IIGGTTVSSYYYDRWQNIGDEYKTDVPKFVYSDYAQFSNRDNLYANSEINVLKGDHIRLHYLNLSYARAFNRNSPQPLHLQFFVNVSNIGMLWTANRYKIDPEYPLAATPPSQYAIGFRCNF